MSVSGSAPRDRMWPSKVPGRALLVSGGLGAARPHPAPHWGSSLARNLCWARAIEMSVNLSAPSVLLPKRQPPPLPFHDCLRIDNNNSNNNDDNNNNKNTRRMIMLPSTVLSIL